MCKAISLLWTGGWDSTFRLIELSFEDVDIYPVYVVDPNRKSKNIEITHMHRIMDALENKPLTKARIHEIEIINLENISPNPQITEAYQIIHEKTQLGSQHEWLARLGKLRPGMEMGTEAGSAESSHILHAIEEFGKLVIDDGIGYLDPKQSSAEGILVLGWFRFPVITRTEKDMLRSIKAWGYEDIMQKIWFCHAPINGKPCGCCHPCEVKMESDMAFLLPPLAQKRYIVYRFCARHLGEVGKKLSRKILRRIKRRT